MIHIFVFFFILILESIFGMDFHDFDSYQYKLTREDVERKIQTYLEKDQSIREFYQLTPEALYIGDLAQEQIDYVLHLTTVSKMTYNNPKKYNGLKNVKVALDPGHFGGAYAELEQRYVSIPGALTSNNESINFNEGTLTYLTACALKSLLEAEGAIVFMTRPGVGRGAVHDSFFKWLENHPALWEKDMTLSHLFRKYYNREDLITRARAINDFAPDITIMIHYNAHPIDKEKDKNTLLTQSNYNLAFIAGAFCANELKKIEDRYEFLRLIVTDDIEQSIKLSGKITSKLIDELNIPLITKEEKVSYTKKACLVQQRGIYSRNLVLTRLVHGPLCYGETLVQNNKEEIYRLSMLNIQIANQPCPKRVEEVAQGYFEGIKNYFNTTCEQSSD